MKCTEGHAPPPKQKDLLYTVLYLKPGTGFSLFTFPITVLIQYLHCKNGKNTSGEQRTRKGDRVQLSAGERHLEAKTGK